MEKMGIATIVNAFIVGKRIHSKRIETLSSYVVLQEINYLKNP